MKRKMIIGTLALAIVTVLGLTAFSFAQASQKPYRHCNRFATLDISVIRVSYVESFFLYRNSRAGKHSAKPFLAPRVLYKSATRATKRNDSAAQVFR